MPFHQRFHAKPRFHAPRPHVRRPSGAPGETLGPDGMPLRVRAPRVGEVLGKVLELHGGSRMSIACEDGFTRMCRIPGKVRRKIQINVGDVCAVRPWSVETNEKGDIEYRYTRMQADQLRAKGLLKQF